MQGREVVIADIGESDGYFGGIYDEPYSNLGLDMFGDLGLDDIPTPGPRAEVPTSSNVVTQAVAQKVAKGELPPPSPPPLTKPVPVVRKGITPPRPPIAKDKIIKLAGLALVGYLIYHYATAKK